MGKNRMLGIAIITLALIGGTGSAIWYANFTANAVAVMDNTQEIEFLYNLNQIDLIPGEEVSVNWTHTNQNGDTPIIVNLLEDPSEFVSSDPLCVLEPGKDIKIAIQMNGAGLQYLIDSNGTKNNASYTLIPGDNVFDLILDSHVLSCPHTSNITISGTV